MGDGYLDPQVYGQIIAIFKALINEGNNPSQNIWELIHPRILDVSKQLFLNGHYANAACDAFIEINDRVKRMHHDANPGVIDIPDEQALMNKVFSEKEPMQFNEHDADSCLDTLRKGMSGKCEFYWTLILLYIEKTNASPIIVSATCFDGLIA